MIIYNSIIDVQKTPEEEIMRYIVREIVAVELQFIYLVLTQVHRLHSIY